MTRMTQANEKEQSVRMLLDRHTRITHRSFVDHLMRVLPFPALKGAAKSRPRQEEWESLEATVRKIIDVMNEPVVVTRLVNGEGEPVHLVGLAEASALVGMSHRTLYDVSLTHPAFPAPAVVTSTARLWVAQDIESFCRAHRPSDGWKVPRVAKKRQEKET